MTDRDEIQSCLFSAISARNETLLEDFEAAWRRGERPAIADVWASGGNEVALLVELVHTDLEFRLDTGEPARVEDYLAAFPYLAADAKVVVELVAREFELRRPQEPALNADDFQARFPELAAELSLRLDRMQRTAETKPAASAIDDTPAVAGTPAADERYLPRLPGFELVEELGSGGMGVVYKARQVALKRWVAVKMLRAGFSADGDEMVRFRREAEAVARLKHPNIIQIHDIGVNEGRPYLVLELAERGSLAAQADFRALGERFVEAATLVETLARAVEVAHGNGVVHRDIKPANVLIAADGTPKLSDFGLAKELNAGDGRTSSSVVLGTPSYMAPEQARGERELGPACDIYALGALFYELVTGRPPHLAESALATLELLRTQEPVPPQRLAPRTPRDLETIVLACLEREPNRRYASAAQLAEDLRRFRAGEPVRARRTGPLRRAAKWARRKPAMAASLVFLALSIGAVIGAAVWVRSRGDAVPVAPVDRVGAARGLKRAYQAWQTGNVQEAQELLDAHAESGGIDMRGFAWRYLERLCGCVATLGEPARPARWACFSPDGRTVATAGDGRGVRLWNAEIFQPRVTLAEAAGVLNRVQFGADGRTLVTAGVNHQLREWDVATGSQRRQLKVELPNNGPWALSSDCELFAVLVPAGDSTNGERPIIIQESDTGNEIQRFAPHAGGTTCLAFSPDGRWLASGGEDRKIVARDLRGEQPPIELMHGNVPLVVTFAPTEFLVLSGERDGAVTLWDVSAQTPNGFGSGGGAISALGFSADGSVRVAATCASTR